MGYSRARRRNAGEPSETGGNGVPGGAADGGEGPAEGQGPGEGQPPAGGSKPPARPRVARATRPRAARGDSGQEDAREAAREPRVSPHLTLQRLPTLRNPVLVMAFEGWNDAGEAASTAAQVIKSQLDGDRFATIDAEEFFVFTERRPRCASPGAASAGWTGPPTSSSPASTPATTRTPVTWWCSWGRSPTCAGASSGTW